MAPNGKLVVLLDQTVFVAGGRLSGVVQLLTEDVHTASALDIYFTVSESLTFQSSAVAKSVLYTISVPLWRANNERGFGFRKGTHSFPFALQIPEGLPPSFDDGKKFRVAYTINSVLFSVGGNAKHNLSVTRDANVCENLPANLQNMVNIPSTAEGKKKLLFGGDKDLQMTIRSNKSIYAAGEPMYLCLDVINESTKRVRGIKTEVRRTITELPGQQGPVSVSVSSPNSHPERVTNVQVVAGKAKTKVISKAEFFSLDFECLPKSHRQLVIDVPSPIDARTVVGTKLFCVEWSVYVALDTAWSKNLAVEVPIKIATSAAYNTIFFPTVSQTVVHSVDSVPQIQTGDGSDDESSVYEAMPAQPVPYPSQQQSPQQQPASVYPASAITYSAQPAKASSSNM
eukprot:ANDGO_02516.mRNA.1 hypothetical protein CAOG_03562